MDKIAIRKIIENHVSCLSGNSFQEFCNRILSELYSDFTPVRAGGTHGDMKNDGYCPKQRMFFAAHATRGEAASKTKDKISEDLTGCLEKQQSVKTWVYLTNDTLTGEIEKYVDTLRKEHPQVEIETWGHIKIANKLSSLDTKIISQILEYNIEDGQLIQELNAEIERGVDLIKEGQPKLALISFEKLWKHHNDKMSPHQKYRVKANIGYSYDRLEKYELAAKYWLDAAQYDKEHEKARGHECLAYCYLGNSLKAKELAEKLLVDYPQERLAWLVFLRTKPKSESFEQVKAEVPEHLHDDADIAVCLADIAVNEHKYEDAEFYISKAISDIPDQPRIKEKLGELLIEKTRVEEIISGVVGLTNTEKQYLEKANDIYSECYESYLESNVSSSQARVLAQKYLVNLCLKDATEASNNIKLAFQLAPDDQEIIFKYSMYLSQEEQLDEAIKLLSGYLKNNKSSRHAQFIARLLFKRNNEGDINEAKRILKDYVGCIDEEIDGYYISYLSLLLMAITQTEGKEKALEYLEQIEHDEIHDNSYEILKCNILLSGNEPEKAIENARVLLERQNGSMALYDRRNFSYLLKVLKLYEEALEILKTFVTPDYIGDDTYEILTCAHECQNISFIIEFCESLRENNLWDKKVLILELDYREKYNDDRGAINLINELFEHFDDAEFTKILNLRLSLIGSRLGRSELIESNPQKLPGLNGVDVQMGSAVVYVLKESGQLLEAVDYAYNLLRLNWNIEEAHQTMFVALSPIGRQLEFKNYEIVEMGTVVMYVVDGSNEERFHIIEDSVYANPDFSRNEYSVDNHVSKLLLGKKVGETICIRRDSILGDSTVAIKSIESKYVYRYRCSFHDYSKLSSQTPFLKSINLEDKDGNVTFDPIAKILENENETTLELEKMYSDGLMPLAYLALSKGVSVFATMNYLAKQDDAIIKCCVGTDDEWKKIEDSLLLDNSEFVLDITTLNSLLLLEDYTIIEELNNVVITEGTLKELRSMEPFSKIYPQGNKCFIFENGKLSLLSYDERQLVDEHERAKKFVQYIENSCEVKSGIVVSKIKDRKTRNDLMRIMSQSCLESMCYAMEAGAILWTDDVSVAYLSINEFECRRVWTQFVFTILHSKGLITEERKIKATLKLLEMNYVFTRISMADFVEAGKIAEWDVDTRPLKNVLDMIENPNVTNIGLYSVACNIIKYIWQQLDSQIAQNITLIMLQKFSKRKGGLGIIYKIMDNCDNIFTVDVVASEKVTRIIAVWLQLNKQNGIIR